MENAICRCLPFTFFVLGKNKPEADKLRREMDSLDIHRADLLKAHGFSPKDLETGKLTLTENTYAIHHFRASWMPIKNRINTKIAQILGPAPTKKIKHLLGRE